MKDIFEQAWATHITVIEIWKLKYSNTQILISWLSRLMCDNYEQKRISLQNQHEKTAYKSAYV